MSRLFEEVKDIIKFELYGAARDSDGCEISYRFGDCNQRKLDVLKHEVIEWLLSEGFAEDEIDVNYKINYCMECYFHRRLILPIQ